MDSPHNATKKYLFIECINYYHDMWPSCGQILKTLTGYSGLKKHAPIPWTNEMQQACEKMHTLMTAKALVAYLDHNKRFDINADA